MLKFAGLPESSGLEATIKRRSLSDSNRNVGKLWGGSGYAGKLQPTERKKLGAYFAPHNKELYTLVGRDFGWEAEVVEA